MNTRETETPRDEDREQPVEAVDRRVSVVGFAFAIGALVGVGLATLWVPERRRRRLPPALHRRLRRARDAGASALSGARRSTRDLAEHLREDAAATLEAAREQLLEMARDQIEQTRKTLQKEYGRLRR